MFLFFCLLNIVKYFEKKFIVKLVRLSFNTKLIRNDSTKRVRIIKAADAYSISIVKKYLKQFLRPSFFRQTEHKIFVEKERHQKWVINLDTSMERRAFHNFSQKNRKKHLKNRNVNIDKVSRKKNIEKGKRKKLLKVTNYIFFTFTQSIF